MQHADAVDEVEGARRERGTVDVALHHMRPLAAGVVAIGGQDRLGEIEAHHLGAEARGVVEMPTEAAARVAAELAAKELRLQR